MHYNAAQSGKISAPDTSAAQSSLYGALAAWYVAAGVKRPEQIIWAELVPFLGLSERDGRDYLAEYIVYRERHEEARVEALRKKVNAGLKAADKERKVVAAAMAESGVGWEQLLDANTQAMLRASLATL